MPRGSAPGERRGGRKAGTPNKRTAEFRAKAQTSAAAVMTAVPGAFAGDAHDLLMLAYKDPALPMDMRIDAAGKAIRYEKPALAQIDMTSESEVRFITSDVPVDREGDAWLNKHGPATH